MMNRRYAHRGTNIAVEWRNELGVSTNNVARRVARSFALTAQWAVVAALALVAVTSAGIAFDRRALGLDTTAYLVAIAAMATVATLLSPPLFFRLPIKARIASCALVPLIFVSLVWTFTIVDEAYRRTPKGALEAKAEAAAAASQMELKRKEEERARQEEERRATSAIFEEHDRDVAAAHHRVQQCINWQGQIPGLVRRVKGALHNPRSFEHVQTEVRTIGDTPVVVMEYRAENGFGAIRTEAVSAFISPDDCSVLAAKKYEPGDFGAE